MTHLAYDTPGRTGTGAAAVIVADAPRCAVAPVCGGVEMLHAAYLRQDFARHYHEVYALGVIEAGAMAFRYRGENLVADAGCVNLVVPGEAHDGHAATGQGWRYRMFYLKPELVRDVAAQMADRPTGLPHFWPGVLHDPALAAQVGRVHRLLQAPEASLLHKESALVALLGQWIDRHADARPASPSLGSEPRAVALARECIHARYGEDLALAELAAVAGLSPCHFLRVFARQVGLSPHEYLTQTRVCAARDLLAGHARLADVAACTGFADQSHMTRQFKRLMGVTPGRYREMLAPSRAV